MKVNVIGGGPGGLYAAILIRKALPHATVTVIERNRPDDTFGFGIVLSEEALASLAAADPESHAAILGAAASWDDVEVRHRGTVARIGRNGFVGCSRVTLLRLLQARARALGVVLRFETEIDAGLAGIDDADLVIAADGVASATRGARRERFGVTVEHGRNHFAWMGTTLPLDAFTFLFRETPHGVIVAHCYPYAPDRATAVIETTPETFARAGLGGLDRAATLAFLEEVFADDLAGHRLLADRTLWRHFPRVRNARWSDGTLVLIGDAKATAHFSIGQGTRLAMEDAIALADAVAHDGGRDVAAALARYEEARRGPTERTQATADWSCAWFETIDRAIDLDPARFTFALMTRAKAIGYDALRLRAPTLVDTLDRVVAAETVARSGTATPSAAPPMFQPFRLRDVTLANRVVVSPMCQYSAVDGEPGDWHLVHYGARAVGGAGLLFTEMTAVSADARITPGCTGLWTDAQEAAWRRIVEFVHENSAGKIAMQLGHAGRKAATRRMWEGADEPLAEGAWQTQSASALAWRPANPTPRETTRADMDAIIADFVAATTRAARAGFDMLELHAAHGYLIGSFVSPLTNRRDDAYGGALANRMRFPLELFGAMRATWPAGKPMSVRISASDWAAGGLSPDDAVAVARMFAEAGCDLIDVSSGGTVADEAPRYGRMYQVPFAERIRAETRLATMCVGAITSSDEVNTIVAAGRADLVAVGRPHLVDPHFTLAAAARYGVTVACPPQYLAGRDQLVRTRERERERAIEEARREDARREEARRTPRDPTAPLAAE